VLGVGVSPDSKFIVTASRDKTAIVWDADSGRSVAVLRGHSDVLTDAKFSPDGEVIVTVSYDKTARTYPRQTFAPLDEILNTAKQMKETIMNGLTKDEKDLYQKLLNASLQNQK
jgi:WD40 repeat protein